MNIYVLLGIIGGLGGLGGIINSALTGEFVMPNTENGTWRPGWIGNVITGLTAAIVIACTYGPMANYDFLDSEDKIESFTLSQAISAIIVGMGGGNILTQLAKNKAENTINKNLLETTENLIKTLEEEDSNDGQR